VDSLNMDNNTLKGILEAEIDNSLGFIQTETTDERRRSLQYYNREPYGNEVEGRSSIVTGEVAEVVDGALPQLLRVFTQSDEMVRFEPKGAGDEEKAKQATEYVNWVLNHDNSGVILFHNWFKDALLQKNGIVKVYWDDQTDVTKEKYKNLNEEELTMLLADPEVEVVSQQMEEVEMAQTVDQMTGMPLPPVFSYSVTLKRTKNNGKVIVENVPPEEFLISKKARTIADAPFVAHRKLTTRSELIAMGFNRAIVEKLPSYSDLTFTEERVARYDRGEMPDEQSSLDKAMQDVEVYECYIKTDFDKDGIAELRKVTYAGSEILDNEEVDFVPFCSICPIPMPHKFFGHSLADRAIDLQLIKSTVTRQILDNLYLTNNARMGVVEGQVNLDDMLTVTAGGIVRIKNPNAIVPLSVPATASQSFPMLQYLDQVQSKRTGVNDVQQGLDPNILQNTTATAVAAMQSAAAGKVEMVARIFAETGVKDLFEKILHLLCKYQDKAKIIRLRGKYVSIDPREWVNGFDISINVGLGTGNKQEQMAMVAMVLQKQEQILGTQGFNNPLVTLTQYRETLGRFIEAAGYKDSSEFFKEIPPELEQQIANPQPQQAPVDPAVQAYMAQAQAQMQIDQAKAQQQMALDQQKAEADMQLQMAKAQAEIQLKREKAQADLELKTAEFQAEAQLKAMTIGAGISNSPNIPNL
jgi:predicted GNAT family acetyltransferase